MRTLAIVLALLPAFLAACAQKPELVAPEVLVSPYGPAAQPVLWAVAPLSNESGTSFADMLMITDAVIARAAEVRGVSVLPLNRTLAAMRVLKMDAVRSPAQARTLAQALGTDAIIVGSITAYDPYDPPKLGVILGLYTRTAAPTRAIDPRALEAAAAERPANVYDDDPAAVVSEHLDAQNHEVLMNVQRYAAGRHDHRSALGWRRYTASMELYTEFAAYWSVYRLLQEERLRVARTGVATASAAR